VKSILHIELDGQHWEYEQGSLMYQEAKVFQIQIGMTVGQWENGLNTGDISCLAALWWLCRQRDGERLKFDDMEFNVQDFMAGITERDEHGNEIVRNKAGDVEKLIAPDGTESAPELPDPTSSPETSTGEKPPSGSPPPRSTESNAGTSAG
jgi:hypothetical protein